MHHESVTILLFLNNNSNNKGYMPYTVTVNTHKSFCILKINLQFKEYSDNIELSMSSHDI